MTRPFFTNDARTHNIATIEDYIKAVENCRLIIPADYQSKLSEYTTWIAKSRKVLYVAKGPSAEKAADISKDFGIIATVNEACTIMPTVDFAFFTDRITLMNSQSSWDKIRWFVVTAMVHGDSISDNPIATDTLGLPPDRTIVITRSQIDWNEQIIDNLIRNDVIVTTDTSVMGLHFLHLAGYRSFHLYGHDGGIGYAKTMPNISNNRDMSRFRNEIETIGRLCVDRFSSVMYFADGLVIGSPV